MIQKCEVLTTTTVKITVFWGTISCTGRYIPVLQRDLLPPSSEQAT
jgi:hypothetical protein